MSEHNRSNNKKTFSKDTADTAAILNKYSISWMRLNAKSTL